MRCASTGSPPACRRRPQLRNASKAAAAPGRTGHAERFDRSPCAWLHLGCIRRGAAVLLLCGLAGATQAAERPAAKPPDEAPPAPAAEGRADPAGKAEAARDEGPRQEVFLPSEEISEDFAAPFPVDI